MQSGCREAPGAWGPQGRQSAKPAWEALALGDPSRGTGTGCRALRGVGGPFHPIVSAHTYPQCLPITSRTKVLWWLEKRKGTCTHHGWEELGHGDTSAVRAAHAARLLGDCGRRPSFPNRTRFLQKQKLLQETFKLL